MRVGCLLRIDSLRMWARVLAKRRGNIYGAIKVHGDAMFTAAVKSLDGAKPNINPKTNRNPNTNLTVILI